MDHHTGRSAGAGNSARQPRRLVGTSGSRPMTITGGCQCGAVRYEIAGSNPPVYLCHCRECQKQSASACGISLPISRERFSISGETATWERQSHSGAVTRCHFCKNCGTRLYHSSTDNPERLTVKGGSLDDTSAIMPLAHLWVSRKQPWIVIDDDVPVHQTQPDDLSAWRNGLVAQWR